MIPRKLLLIIFSLGLLLFFIMPWFAPVALDTFDFDYLKPGNGIAGYEVNKYHNALRGMPGLDQIKKFTGKNVASPVYYLAFLIPAFAVACIVTSLIGTGARIMGIITGALPMAGFAAMLMQFGPSLLNHMTYGAFLTLAAGLSMVVASLTKS